jgi:hypothetical protein
MAIYKISRIIELISKVFCMPESLSAPIVAQAESLNESKKPPTIAVKPLQARLATLKISLVKQESPAAKSHDEGLNLAPVNNQEKLRQLRLLRPDYDLKAWEIRCLEVNQDEIEAIHQMEILKMNFIVFYHLISAG